MGSWSLLVRGPFHNRDRVISVLCCTLKRLVSTPVATISTSVEQLPLDPKLEQLVSRICELNLAETAIVVRVLRQRLNIPEYSLASAVPEASRSGGAASKGDAKDEKAVEEKTQFNVTLEKFEATSKAKVIREVKVIMPQLSLVEAKAFVESVPKILKEKISRVDAEKLKATFEALGATIDIG